MDYRVEEILIEIENNLSQMQTAQDFAKSLNVSVSRFQHLFKEEVGMSFSNHVKNLRLQKARQLLEVTHLSVKEIQAKVGATDETHFSRDFKQKFDKTPTEYRKNFRNSRIG